MPSKSDKQRRFMRAAAHSKEFADKVGIDQSVAQEFEAADEEVKSRNRAEYQARKHLNNKRKK